MNLLLIETATQVCSVALAADGRIAARRESDTPNAHSTCLQVFIDEVLKECRLQPRDLSAVCVSAGPGSYTGLLSAPTLLSMAALYYRQHPDYQGLVCPMIDARRMECYTMFVAPSLEILRPTAADIVEEGIYNQYLDAHEVMFVGDGAAKCREVLGAHPHARFDLDFRPSAEGLLPIAMQNLQEGRHEDVAYFEPFYLKDFVAKKSVVHGLR